jgi:hypothetical protein
MRAFSRTARARSGGRCSQVLPVARIHRRCRTHRAEGPGSSSRGMRCQPHFTVGSCSCHGRGAGSFALALAPAALSQRPRSPLESQRRREARGCADTTQSSEPTRAATSTSLSRLGFSLEHERHFLPCFPDISGSSRVRRTSTSSSAFERWDSMASGDERQARRARSGVPTAARRFARRSAGGAESGGSFAVNSGLHGRRMHPRRPIRSRKTSVEEGPDSAPE